MVWAPSRCTNLQAQLPLLAMAAGCVVLSVVVAVVPAPSATAARMTSSWVLIGVGAGCSALAVRARASASTAERPLWRQLATALALLSAAALTSAALAAHGYSGAALAGPVTAATVMAFPLVYSALVTWNRTATRLADPHEMLNGVSALAAVTAAVCLVLDASGGGSSTWAQTAAAVQIAAAFVLVGTAVSVAAIAATARDVRSWLLAAAFAPGGLVAALDSIDGPAEWSVLAPGLTVLLVGCASALEPRQLVPQPTAPTASSVGGHAVLVVSVGLLVVVPLVGATQVATWLAAVAACGAGTRLLITTRDLAQLETMREEARTDELTGLANRRALLAELDRRPPAGRSRVFALVDLDRFKEVNDSLGHAAGDILLREVAVRLSGVAGPDGLVGRLGGDEFAVVGPPGSRGTAAERADVLGTAIRQRLTGAFDLGGSLVHVRASVGLSLEAAGAVPGRLIREADVAMYRAKRSRGGVQLYDELLEEDLVDGLLVAEDLRTAISAGQLVLHYQPQVAICSGRAIGVEALVRWQHPTRGLLSPADFLDVAEVNGLMPTLTDVVLGLAVSQLADWWTERRQLRMSVNLSASALQDAALPGRLARLLEAGCLPPEALVLEITETTAITDSERSLAVLAHLAELGVGISLDDFGTGWSSLTYLRELPATELKLDRSFTRDLATDARVHAIVTSTVDMAHALGLRVVAEGVEDERTLLLLAALGCDESQGYLHSAALPPKDLVRWQELGELEWERPVEDFARR